MWKRRSKQCARQATTLLEVVVGIALLATLLVSILVAYRGHANQIRSAHIRMSAVQLTDELLHQWLHKDAMPAAGSAGVFAENNALRWQLVAVHTPRETKLPVTLLRLDVYDSSLAPARIPLLSVELFTSSQLVTP